MNRSDKDNAADDWEDGAQEPEFKPLTREAEVRVMNLIGATRHFIARPFLYSGIWQGLLGAVIAWLLLQALLWLLREPALTLLSFYGEQYRFIGMDARAVLVLLLGGITLGWAGAWLSVSRHLSRFD